MFYKQTLPLGGRYCFSMFYHMYGNNIGMLKVYVKPVNTPLSNSHIVWQETGNQGEIWRKAQASVTSVQDDFQVSERLIKSIVL